MRQISIKRILEYYDGVQVFVGGDQLLVPYICVLVESTASTDKYLCVPASAQRLATLLRGEVDLRQFVIDSETREYYVADAADGQLNSIELQQIDRANVPEAWLPDSGLTFDSTVSECQALIDEVITKGITVFQWRLNPPEAESEPKIYAEKLSRATSIIQRLLRHAMKKVKRSSTEIARNLIDIDTDSRLEVYAFSPGSFTLHLQPAAQPDLFGYSKMEEALRVLDTIVAYSGDPQTTVSELSSIGIHFATAYRDLCQFIKDAETDIGYRWASPDDLIVSTRAITRAQAGPLYDAIIERRDLSADEVELIGRLSKVDKNRGTWRLKRQDDDHEFSGQSEVDLSGLVIETEVYRFKCEKQIEIEQGTMREIEKLYLKSFERL